MSKAKNYYQRLKRRKKRGLKPESIEAFRTCGKPLNKKGFKTFINNDIIPSLMIDLEKRNASEDDK